MSEIDWKDPQLQGVLLGSLIALVGVALAALAGVVGAGIGASAAREATRAAQTEGDKDRALAETARKEARDDERRARYRDQKRELYVRLVAACDGHKREVEQQVEWRRDKVRGYGGADPGINPSEPARAAYLAVALISDIEVTNAAEALYRATTDLGAHHAYVHGDEPLDSPDEVKWRADLNAWNSAYAAFESAARGDLSA